MLILTRKLEESIVIEGGIRLTVLGIENGRVKLGITAPDGVMILRKELSDTTAVGGKLAA